MDEEAHSGFPSWLRWLTFTRLITLVTFVAIFAMAARIPTDTDSWWHLQSGRWIIENRAIPLTDPFSHTRLGEPWIDHGWLAQAAIFLAWEWLGYGGLVLFLAALVTAAFSFAWMQCRQANMWLRAFVFIIAAASTSIIWAIRPQMVSFLLTSIVAYLLYRFKQGSIKSLWLLPVIMLIWVNIHGGFAIGFILMVAYLFGETVNQLLHMWQVKSDATPVSADPQGIGWRGIGLLLLVMAICFLLLPLNPNTTQMWSYPFRTVGIGVLQDYIQEWQAPDFHAFYLHPFIWLLLAALTVFGLAGRRADFTELTLVALFAYMSLLAVRNIPLFALVNAPVIVRVGTQAWARWRGQGKEWSSSQKGLALAVNWLLLLFVLLVALVRFADAASITTNEAEQAQTLPVGAIAYLQEAQPAGPLFNDYNWGGYLIWRLPQYPVFVDGRTDLYDDDFLRDYLLIDAAGNGWQERLDAYGVRLAVISPYSALAQALAQEPDWQEVYADDMALVFARQAAVP
ncbi:MAG: hypothetical protein H6660_02385 [Ardenticatenaceae bacterium]|nr:hypothetical protein [Ardenticatenaceae bacterium]